MTSIFQAPFPVCCVVTPGRGPRRAAPKPNRAADRRYDLGNAADIWGIWGMQRAHLVTDAHGHALHEACPACHLCALHQSRAVVRYAL